MWQSLCTLNTLQTIALDFGGHLTTVIWLFPVGLWLPHKELWTQQESLLAFQVCGWWHQKLMRNGKDRQNRKSDVTAIPTYPLTHTCTCTHIHMYTQTHICIYFLHTCNVPSHLITLCSKQNVLSLHVSLMLGEFSLGSLSLEIIWALNWLMSDSISLMHPPYLSSIVVFLCLLCGTNAQSNARLGNA